MDHKIELLAPCGNLETVKAAVQNGADAIYMGGFKFGARGEASRNPHEDLIKAIAYAHERGVKCYITVNTLIRDDEMEECLEYLSFLQNAGADAVILQDMGLAYLVTRNFPNLETHASTQTTCVNSWDGQFLKSMGFQRMVAARENTLEELSSIKKNTGLSVEVFAHGALCVCYSGRCLFSFFQGGRSGNRGECAQSCRMSYALEGSTEKTPSSYLLSPKDLRILEHLPALKDHGMDSLKIEGRLRRMEYVAVVTNAYRQGIDALYSDTALDLSSLIRETEHVFNRKSTKGYLMGALGSALMNPDSPKSSGTLVGKVVENNPKKKRLRFQLLDDLSKGDGLSTGEYVGRILKGSAIYDHARKGEVVEIDYIGNISPGTLLYKTHHKELMDRAAASISKERRLFPLRMKFTLRLHEKAILWVEDDAGNQVTVQSDEIKGEQALHKALQSDVVKRGLLKLGGTPFYGEEVECSLDGVSTLSMASINALRQQAVLLLLEERRRQPLLKTLHEDFRKELIQWDPPVVQRKKASIQENFKDPQKEHPAQGAGRCPKTVGDEIQWSVRCKTKEQLQALKIFPFQRIYVDNLSLYEEGCNLYTQEVMYFALPQIVREREKSALNTLLSKTKGNYLVNSFGLLEILQDCKTVADYGLNLYNKYSLDLPKAHLVTPSLEILYSPQRMQLQDAWNKGSLEIPVYLWPVLMVSEFCPHKDDQGHCKEKHCVNEKAFLVHSQGHKFPLGQDAFCRSLIYHHAPKSLEKEMELFVNMGIRHFRLEFLRETSQEVQERIRQFTQKRFFAAPLAPRDLSSQGAKSFCR